jgi:hypothetical protein
MASSSPPVHPPPANPLSSSMDVVNTQALEWWRNPTLFLDQRSAESFTCSICMFILNDPVGLSSCGHLFCLKCWEELITKRDSNSPVSCPTCLQVVPTREGRLRLTRNVAVRRYIEETLQFRCQHRIAEEDGETLSPCEAVLTMGPQGESARLHQAEQCLKEECGHCDRMVAPTLMRMVAPTLMSLHHIQECVYTCGWCHKSIPC